MDKNLRAKEALEILLHSTTETTANRLWAANCALRLDCPDRFLKEELIACRKHAFETIIVPRRREMLEKINHICETSGMRDNVIQSALIAIQEILSQNINVISGWELWEENKDKTEIVDNLSRKTEPLSADAVESMATMTRERVMKRLREKQSITASRARELIQETKDVLVLSETYGASLDMIESVDKQVRADEQATLDKEWKKNKKRNGRI